MAITFIQEKKKQRYLILSFALIIFLTLSVVWWGFMRNKKVTYTPSAVPATIYTPPDIEINFQTLESFRSQKFTPFGGVSAFNGSFGRANPFIVY